MPPQNLRRKTASDKKEKVGLFSVGSLEAKLSLILPPLLASSNINLCCCKNYEYPRILSPELIQEIGGLLQETKITSVAFDLRIRNGENTSYLRHSRTLSQSLQKLCKSMGISLSITMSNGTLFMGNAVGSFTEKIEASQVIRGDGPLDLTKFALEIGSDYLLMTKKLSQRIEAKKYLRDQIISGELSMSPTFSAEKITITSSEKGYIHHLSLDRLQALKSNLLSAHADSGFILTKKTGDWIAKGDDILDIYFPVDREMGIAQEDFQSVFAVSPVPSKHQPLILERIGADIRA